VEYRRLASWDSRKHNATPTTSTAGGLCFLLHLHGKTFPQPPAQLVAFGGGAKLPTTSTAGGLCFLLHLCGSNHQLSWGSLFFAAPRGKAFLPTTS